MIVVGASLGIFILAMVITVTDFGLGIFEIESFKEMKNG